MTKKILLLHGNRQTGQLLLGRLDRFRKRLFSELEIDLVAPDAPFEAVCDPQGGEEANSIHLTWWKIHENVYEGLEATIALLHSHLWNNDDVVGIMGFSQGARLLHLLLLLRQDQADADSSSRARARSQTLLPSLEFAILVSGYDAPMPANFPLEQLRKITLPSLHVLGENDTLILPEQSRALMKSYDQPKMYSHPGRHFVPTKKIDIDIYMDFIGTYMIPAQQLNQNVISHTIVVEEAAKMQADEVRSLLAMFPDEITVKSELEQDDDGDFQFQYPIRYQVKMIATDPGENNLWPVRPLTIQVSYPRTYPLEIVPVFELIHQNTNFEFPSSRVDAVLRILRETSQLEMGIPSVLSGMYGIKAYLDESPVEEGKEFCQITAVVPKDCNAYFDGGVHKQALSRKMIDCIAQSPPEIIALRNLEGIKIAERILKELRLKKNFRPSSKTTNSDGGSWHYVIGLIGKPSAGKSTFFNAATSFARGYGASMAAHPFTTIDPNTGYCFVPAPIGSCPEDDSVHPCDYGSTHGRSPDGRRFLPVFLKDVAGLVPGAYQGKGKGNQFLNDLTDATVLIHVMDASGTCDPSGNKIAVDGNLEDLSSPLDDLAWIRNELAEWIYSNLAAKWDGIQRRGGDRLTKMFSGYGQREAETHVVLRELERYFDTNYQREHALRHVRNWDQADIQLLVSAFLGVRFPMTLALNKCDLPSSRSHIHAIQQSLPIHGAHHATPMAAKQEMLFVRKHLRKSKLSVGQEADIALSPPTNVWACLTSALSLREPVLVFPVVDMVSYAPLPGLNRCAAEDPSLPSDGMLGCIEASGGSLPSCFDAERGNYAVPNKEKSSKQRLRDALMMKPGSTVEDVFVSLKNRGALCGDFVRAEAACNVGEKSKPIPKFEEMTRNNRIIRIMSNKRMAQPNL